MGGSSLFSGSNIDKCGSFGDDYSLFDCNDDIFKYFSFCLGSYAFGDYRDKCSSSGILVYQACPDFRVVGMRYRISFEVEAEAGLDEVFVWKMEELGYKAKIEVLDDDRI